MNGISIAYMLGIVNSVMAVVGAFGLELTDTQRAAIVGLVNVSLMLAVHLAHRVGEASLTDSAHDLAKQRMTDAAAPTDRR